jgi:hypothetical protein
LEGYDDSNLLQRFATVYLGITEYRVYAPAKATGDVLGWLENSFVRLSSGYGEFESPKDRTWILQAIREKLERPAAKKEAAIMAETDRRKVFVVHGRNSKAREAVFAFLRAIDLAPMEWHTAGDFDAAVEDADLPSGKDKMRLKTFNREYKYAPNADFKRKIWIQFRNETDECLTLRNARWKSIPSGIDATIRVGTFQLLLGNKWCPEEIGTAQLTLPPGELCRLWAAPDDSVTDEEVKRSCKADMLFGSVILFANGEEITVPV